MDPDQRREKRRRREEETSFLVQWPPDPPTLLEASRTTPSPSTPTSPLPTLTLTPTFSTPPPPSSLRHPHPNPGVPNIKTATRCRDCFANPSSPPPPFPDPDADPATALPGCGLDLEEIGVTTECGPGCEYAGEFLTTDEARRRQRTYDELASSGRLSPALLVVREHLPSGKACLGVNINATKAGNVARFINHSCDGGNLLSVLVRISGSLLPRLCFFAAKDISEGEELAFSYEEARLRQKGLPCFCGSDVCCGLLPSEET